MNNAPIPGGDNLAIQTAALARGLTVSLGEGLLGQQVNPVDLEVMTALLTRYLTREVRHSRLTAPLVAKRGERTYHLAYFRARTQDWVLYLVGIYGRHTLPLLEERFDELFSALLYAHWHDDQLDLARLVSLQAWQHRLACATQGFDCTDRHARTLPYTRSYHQPAIPLCNRLN